MPITIGEFDEPQAPLRRRSDCRYAGTGGACASPTLTYTNAEATPKTQLVVDDFPVDAFRFTLTTLVGTADYLGLGFNYAGTLMESAFSLVGATNVTGNSIEPTLKLYGNGTGTQSSCGTGCNFNGSGSASMFDYILRIGSNGGGSSNYVASIVFDIAAPGSLATNPFSQLAFRAQSTSNPEGSIKTDLNPQPQPAPVPLPAAGVLLMGGLGGLAMLRRRKKV